MEFHPWVFIAINMAITGFIQKILLFILHTKDGRQYKITANRQWYH